MRVAVVRYLPPVLVFALYFSGCGAVQPGGAQATTASAGRSSSGPPPDGNPGEASDEVRALVTEALTPQLCPRLLGSFIGLPGPGEARGPAAGTLASAGRWWIRTCTANVQGDRVELAIGGPGWTWVDQETSGFRVRQYVLFEADARLGASVSVGYDRARRVASLWMTPAAGVTAHVTPRGAVSAEPTGLFATVVGAALPLTGASASDRARAQAEQTGSTQMRERLAAGFTMTLGLDTRQVDFMVGALARGETPERPYPPEPGVVWQVNGRAVVHPGGLDAIGPLDVTSPQRLDVTLEEGDGAAVRAVCADAFGRYFDARLRDPAARPPPPSGTHVLELRAANAPQRATLPTLGCPTLLLVAPRAGSALPARVRYRVAPEAGGAAPATPALRRVRVQVVGVTVSPQNPSGHDWDVVGGEADPLVVTASIPLRREVDRTPSVQDRNEVTWHRWLPGAYDLANELPLRFSVYDEDSASNELIGAADLDARAVPEAGGDVALPLRTSGAVPTQTGTLRLRVERAQ